MVRKVEGEITENQNLVRFEASALNAPVKDQLDLMSRNWFSLVPGRTEPIEHKYNDARSKREETIRISCSQPHGIATIHDQDLLIFVISQWIEARRNNLEYSRRVSFSPYQFFTWVGIKPTGSAYQRLRDALKRLSGTQIETTKHFEKGTTRRNVKGQFSWVSEWKVTEENDHIRGVEVVLAEWLYESVRDFHVLTLDRKYFDIRGSVERWLYLYARKAAGNSHGFWKEGFASLYRKSAAQGDFKHFNASLVKVIAKNNLPGIKLRHEKSVSGEDLLFMEMERTREVKGAAVVPEQLTLIEKTPNEQSWQNLLEVMNRRIGEGPTKSWIAKLEFRSFENRVLTLSTPLKFVADRVTEQYNNHIRDIWETFGHELDSINITYPRKQMA